MKIFKNLKLKKVYNDFLPIQGFAMMAVYFWVFIRNDWGRTPSGTQMNEERIHSAQQLEIFFTSFILIGALVLVGAISFWWLLLTPLIYFIVYVLFWLVEIILPPYQTAYKDTCFEREAKQNRSNLNYLDDRPLFNWVHYFKKDR